MSSSSGNVEASENVIKPKRTILVVDDNKLMLEDTCSGKIHSIAITLRGREVS
jgi:hypothetical protein